jgi:hypothetical protein
LTLAIKNITFLISALIIISISFGCLETPMTSPATIDENALLAYGWSQVSVEERSFEQTITNSTSIVLNSATVKYQNERLISDINEQAIEFQESNKLPVSIDLPGSISASIVTYRLSLPAGAKLPTGLVSKIMESKINEIEADNNAGDVQETTTRKITLSDGTETIVRIFSASGNSTDSEMRIVGFVTAFENDDSSTIVMGFVPDGGHHVEIGPVNGTLFYIDGNKEINEMLELVSTIE